MFLAPSIGFTLFPGSDNGVLNISVSAPTGSKEKVLEPYIAQVEQQIAKHPELKLANISVSGNRMSIYLELINKSERDKNVFDIETEITSDLAFLMEQ